MACLSHTAERDLNAHGDKSLGPSKIPRAHFQLWSNTPQYMGLVSLPGTISHSCSSVKLEINENLTTPSGINKKKIRREMGRNSTQRILGLFKDSGEELER